MILSTWLVLLLSLSGPVGVTAGDTPSDEGGSVTVRWEFPDEVEDVTGFVILRAGLDEEFQQVGTTPPHMREFFDEGVENKTSYTYKVGATFPDSTVFSEASLPAVSTPQWFNMHYLNVAVGLVIFCILVLVFIQKAKSGQELFIRKIAGLEAVDEAVGRATEMGRAILYIPGTGYVEDIATIASMNLLGEVAKKAAEYGTRLEVPNRDPVVFTVTREIVKGAYLQVGRPDAFDPDSVFFVVENALAYASAVDGIMMREKPATNFLMGSFAAESLILAETGAAVGAIQISGTDRVTQLPFFVVACDYTLIGEELYAASAYLSREPLMLGALKGQDYGKAIIVGFLLATSLLALAFRVQVLGLFR
jgi:hypothetical protein